MINQYQLLLKNQNSLLDKTRVKILLACILTFLLLRLSFLAIHLHQSQRIFLPHAILPVIWLVCLVMLLRGNSLKTTANIFTASLTVVIWANIFFVQAGIDVVVTQYCMLAVSCGYYLLGPKEGLFYSVINIVPLVSEIVMRNSFGYEIRGRIFHPDVIAYPTLIVGNFVLLVYVHYMFFHTHMLIDQRKQVLKSELEKALAESRLQTAAKTNFVLTMSHQLRTPLNVVQGATSLLLTGKRLPQQEEYLGILRFSTDHLMAAMDHIVDFTSLEKGSVQLANEPFSPGALVKNIYESFRLIAASKQIKFTLDSDLALTDTAVYGDAVRLSQILLHLVDNAFKFTDTGHISIKLGASRTTLDKLRLSFSVTDTGIGIPDDQLSKVLDPFGSTLAQNSRQYHGTLGLAIANQLVRLHGQSLTVQSQEGLGTTVSFNLDCLLVVEQARQTISPGIPDVRDLAGFRILIADDEPLNILVMKRQLERWKASVDSCVDGFQAVEMVSERHYDLILMDINMPRMDGFEAAKTIRQLSDPVKTAIPIFAVTASEEAVKKGVSQSSHIDDYLLKPFKVDELWSKLNFFLNAKSS